MEHQYEHTQFTGEMIAGIAQSTEAASISLLSAIDGTVNAMQGISSIMHGFSKVLSSTADDIKGLEIVESKYIDPDGIAVDAMASASSSLQNFLTKLVLKRSAIDKDARLKGHHCDALHDAYEETMNEVAELVDVLLQARAAVITHDLAAEPRDAAPAFRTVEELIDSLRR